MESVIYWPRHRQSNPGRIGSINFPFSEALIYLNPTLHLKVHQEIEKEAPAIKQITFKQNEKIKIIILIITINIIPAITTNEAVIQN